MNVRKRIRAAVASLLLAFSLVVHLPEADAATWYVDPLGGGSGTSPSDPMMPQLAIYRASSGDTILFAAGVYALGTSVYLDVNVSAKQLRLVGAGSGVTILDVSASYILVSGFAAVEYTGFSFEGGPAPAGLSVSGSTIVVSESEFTGFLDGAVQVTNASQAVFTGVEFSRNRYGLLSIANSDLIVKNCDFFANVEFGIAISSPGSSTHVSASGFEANGDGVRIFGGPSVSASTIESNRFERNARGIAFLYGGVGSAGDTVYGNEFVGNTDAAILSGIPGSSVDFEANWLEGNARGIYLDGTSDIVHNNVVIESIGGIGLAANGIESIGGAAEIAHNTVVGNGRHGILVRGGDQSLVVNNASVRNSGRGVAAFSSPMARVGSNNSFGNSINLSGPFTNLGGHMFLPPRFWSPTDFRLRAFSPMIDAADWTHFFEDEDHAGWPRAPMYTDIGAYEY